MEEKGTFLDSLKSASAWGLVAVLLLLAFFLSDILVAFLAAVIFAIALDKPIDKLVKKKISRKFAVFSIYILFLAIIILVLYSLFPPLIKETGNFINNFPAYVEKISNSGADNISSNLEESDISQYLNIIGANSQTIFQKITVIFGGIASFVVIFFVAFFLNIQKNGVRNFVFIWVPKKNLSQVNDFFGKMEESVSGWLWGKLLSSIIVSILVYIGLALIGIPYALVFAFLALVLNFIPFFGSIFAAITPVLIGFSNSFLDGVLVLALYLVINNIIEGFILMPFLMKKTVNINPALLIFCVLIGGQLAGILGIIISIPITAIISLLVKEFLEKKGLFSEEKNEIPGI